MLKCLKYLLYVSQFHVLAGKQMGKIVSPLTQEKNKAKFKSEMLQSFCNFYLNVNPQEEDSEGMDHILGICHG